MDKIKTIMIQDSKTCNSIRKTWTMMKLMKIGKIGMFPLKRNNIHLAKTGRNSKLANQ